MRCPEAFLNAKTYATAVSIAADLLKESSIIVLYNPLEVYYFRKQTSVESHLDVEIQ